MQSWLDTCIDEMLALEQQNVKTEWVLSAWDEAFNSGYKVSGKNLRQGLQRG